MILMIYSKCIVYSVYDNVSWFIVKDVAQHRLRNLIKKLSIDSIEASIVEYMSLIRPGLTVSFIELKI